MRIFTRCGLYVTTKAWMGPTMQRSATRSLRYPLTSPSSVSKPQYGRHRASLEAFPVPPLSQRYANHTSLGPVAHIIVQVLVRGLVPGYTSAASLLSHIKAAPTRRLVFGRDCGVLVPHVTQLGSISNNHPPATRENVFANFKRIGRLTGALRGIGGHDNRRGTAKDLAKSTRFKGGVSRDVGFALNHSVNATNDGVTDRYADALVDSVGAHRAWRLKYPSRMLSNPNWKLLRG